MYSSKYPFLICSESFSSFDDLKEIKDEQLSCWIKEKQFIFPKKEGEWDQKHLLPSNGEHTLTFERHIGSKEIVEEEYKKICGTTVGSKKLQLIILRVFLDEERKSWVDEAICLTERQLGIYRVKSFSFSKDPSSTSSNDPTSRQKPVNSKAVAFLEKLGWMAKLPQRFCKGDDDEWLQMRESLVFLHFAEINTHLVKDSDKLKEGDVKTELFLRINDENEGIGDYHICSVRLDKTRPLDFSFQALTPFFSVSTFHGWEILKKGEQPNEQPSLLKLEQLNEEKEVIMLMSEKENGGVGVRGCNIEHPLLLVEGSEKERAVQYFPFCAYHVRDSLLSLRRIPRFVDLVEKSASLLHPVALYCLTVIYSEYNFEVDGQPIEDYLAQELPKGTFDGFSNFEKGMVASFLGMNEEAKKYLENGTSALEKYHYACRFEGPERVQKLKGLCNAFPHAFFTLANYEEWDENKEEAINKGDPKALICHFCSLEDEIIPESLPFDMAKRAFVLGSFDAGFSLYKHQKISQQELENKIGSLLETKEEPTFHTKGLSTRKKRMFCFEEEDEREEKRRKSEYPED